MQQLQNRSQENGENLNVKIAEILCTKTENIWQTKSNKLEQTIRKKYYRSTRGTNDFKYCQPRNNSALLYCSDARKDKRRKMKMVTYMHIPRIF
jgi:hypothetical protein